LETSALKPSSPYSASKAAADLLVLSYAKTYGLPTTISRSTNNYGKYQHEEKLIPKIIQMVGAGMRIPIYGDGKNVRDWLHVDDHCRAIDLILRQGKNGEIYNVAANNEIDNLTLAKHILKLLGCNESQISFVKDRKGHDRRYSVSAQKLINELGWRAEVPFESGLQETIEHYKA
jgi:dTDP-glucose 4,6-dehydratase